MTYVKFDDWARLPGADAEVWRHGALLWTGMIDTATTDSMIAWIISAPYGDRFLLDKANGFELRISREQAIRRADPVSQAASSP